MITKYFKKNTVKIINYRKWYFHLDHLGCVFWEKTTNCFRENTLKQMSFHHIVATDAVIVDEFGLYDYKKSNRTKKHLAKQIKFCLIVCFHLQLRVISFLLVGLIFIFYYNNAKIVIRY